MKVCMYLAIVSLTMCKKRGKNVEDAGRESKNRFATKYLIEKIVKLSGGTHSSSQYFKSNQLTIIRWNP